MGDIDVFEINEAFASQATFCAQHLGVPKEKLNPRGGALAIGHPLGMTGSRMIVTLMSELERTQKKYGLVSMCIGTGMGACGVFERE
jgi:acetyl-CoA acyltransferase 1